MDGRDDRHWWTPEGLIGTGTGPLVLDEEKKRWSTTRLTEGSCTNMPKKKNMMTFFTIACLDLCLPKIVNCRARCSKTNVAVLVSIVEIPLRLSFSLST